MMARGRRRWLQRCGITVDDGGGGGGDGDGWGCWPVVLERRFMMNEWALVFDHLRPSY